MNIDELLSSSEEFLKLAKKYNSPRKGMKSRWSTKYKKKIDCNNPKGFSQKAYCARKRRGGNYKSDVNDLSFDEIVSSVKETAQSVGGKIKKELEGLKSSYEKGEIIPKDLTKKIKNIFDDKSTSTFLTFENKRFVPTPPIKETYFSSGGFGVKKPGGRSHQGVDLRPATGRGTPVYPISPGKVISISTEDSGTNPLGGNTVSIQHGDTGYKSYYAHLKDIHVSIGQNVDIDDVIGTVGNSGNAKGTISHLHFEVSKNGSKVDPATLFYVPPYTPFSKEKEQLEYTNLV